MVRPPSAALLPALLLFSVKLSFAVQSPYDSNICVTRAQIHIRTDLDQMVLDIGTRLEITNFAPQAAEAADIQLCVPGDYGNLQLQMRGAQWVAGTQRSAAPVSEKVIPSPYNPNKQWVLQRIAFPAPLKPGAKTTVNFEYSIKNRREDAPFPFFTDREGRRELYLISDMNWLPMIFAAVKPGQFPNVYQPVWELILEHPSSCQAVVDGKLIARTPRGSTILEEWKSIVGGMPQLLVAPYQVTQRRLGGLTLEIYTPRDTELEKNARIVIGDLLNTLTFYCKIFGNPGTTIYRVVITHASNGGHALFMGQALASSYLAGLDISTMTHEMAHTWWGGSLTSFKEGSKFLRESMAGFSSMWAMRHLRGEDAFRQDILQAKVNTFCPYPASTLTRPQAPLIEQEGYPSSAIVRANYVKGPLVLNELRRELGDAVFFRFLNRFIRRYAGRNVTMTDFLKTLDLFASPETSSHFKEMCWSAGYPSHRVVRFLSKPAKSGFEAVVTIRNDGEVGSSCPILFKTDAGQQRNVLALRAKSEGEFHFATSAPVTEVILDPEWTAYQYTPGQQWALWEQLDESTFSGRNWNWFNKAYVTYQLGHPLQAADLLTRYFDIYQRSSKKTLAKLGQDPLHASYLYWRGLFRLAAGQVAEAESDIGLAIPGMAAAVSAPEMLQAYVLAGLARDGQPASDMTRLLGRLTGREIALPEKLDNRAAVRQRIDEWLRWWNEEGKSVRLRLDGLTDAYPQLRPTLQKQP